MRDLNFFEPYVEKRKHKFNKSYIFYALCILALTGITVYGIYNQIRIGTLNREIKDRVAIAEEPTTVKKVEEIKALETEVSTFRAEVEKIVQLDKSIEDNDIIGEQLLQQIKSKMPADLFLSNFSAYDREIQISGISKDKYSIAEFEKGLEAIEDTESIFVSNITSTEDYYNFVLILTLKEVAIDGITPIEE